jgi:hypothetical protein
MDIRFWGAFNAAKYGAGKMNAGGSITFMSGTTARRPLRGVVSQNLIRAGVNAIQAGQERQDGRVRAEGRRIGDDSVGRSY